MGLQVVNTRIQIYHPIYASLKLSAALFQMYYLPLQLQKIAQWLLLLVYSIVFCTQFLRLLLLFNGSQATKRDFLQRVEK